MQKLLEGRTAFVTGSGSGIGRETAIALAEEGAKIAVADLNAEAAAETVSLITKAGGEAFAIKLDVTVKEAVDQAVDAVVKRWGQLDIAFNNAGISIEGIGCAWDDIAANDKTMNINYRGVLLCMSAELRHMAAAGSGAIINTSSIAGISSSGGTGYAASKHAVIGLTRTAAKTFAGRNVRVNAVCPGVIETPLTTELLAQYGKEMAAMQPMPRFGNARDIANAVVFLASDRASFITGHPLVIDGGHMVL
jgi:NAD(P)-dependent dehydrogenase (short-subunit alcohol dehydrogenase family)